MLLTFCLICLYLGIGFLFYKKLRKMALMVLAACSLFFILSECFIQLKWDSAILPTKPDQIRYLNYGKYCRDHPKLSFNVAIANYSQEISYAPGQSKAYYYIACLSYRYSDYPVFNLRLINAIGGLLTYFFGIFFIQLFQARKELSISSLSLLFLPSLWIFQILIIRESLLLTVSAAYFYFAYQYYMQNKILKYQIFIVGICLLVLASLRAHLAVALALQFATLFFAKLVPRHKFITGMSITIGLLAMSIWPLVEKKYPLFNYIYEILIYPISTLPVFLKNFLIDASGMAFLNSVHLRDNLSKIITNRVIMFDSLIIPIFFALIFLYRKLYKNLFVLSLLMPGFFFYYACYYTAIFRFEQSLPYSFRVSLPFHFLFSLVIIAQITSFKLKEHLK